MSRPSLLSLPLLSQSVLPAFSRFCALLLFVPSLTLFSSPCSPSCSAPAPVLTSSVQLHHHRFWLGSAFPPTLIHLSLAPALSAQLPLGYRLPAWLNHGLSPCCLACHLLVPHLTCPTIKPGFLSPLSCT